MEFFNKITNKVSEWNAAQYEKKINTNRDKGTCPDCYGRGFYIVDAFFDPTCPSCNGSGSFSDWAETTQQQLEQCFYVFTFEPFNGRDGHQFTFMIPSNIG